MILTAATGKILFRFWNITSGGNFMDEKIMAQSLEEIKASFEAPTHKVVDGVQVDLTAEEVEATLNMWADNELADSLMKNLMVTSMIELTLTHSLQNN